MIGLLQNRPGFLLRRAHQLSVALFEQHCKDFNLTPAQYGVLYVVSASVCIDQTGLSRALGLDKVTTLHVVRGLEARGLLVRRPSKEDARRLDIVLSEAGHRVLRDAMPMAKQSSDKLLQPLSPPQQAELLYLLDLLCRGLESEARAPLTRSDDAEKF